MAWASFKDEAVEGLSQDGVEAPAEVGPPKYKKSGVPSPDFGKAKPDDEPGLPELPWW